MWETKRAELFPNEDWLEFHKLGLYWKLWESIEKSEGFSIKIVVFEINFLKDHKRTRSLVYISRV